MNRRFHSIVLLLSVVLSAIPALGFNPGPDVIRECPKCEQLIIQETTLSGNTFGARFWTDGKMIAPMLPDRPWLVKCPKCSAAFWIDDAKKLGEQNRWDEKNAWSDAIEVVSPTEEDFLAVLSEEDLSEKKQLYARQHAWWAMNDSVRTNFQATLVMTDEQRANLQVLTTILDEKDDYQRILKAEVLREIGDYGQSLGLLDKEVEEQLKDLAAFIGKLAENKNHLVQEITTEQ